MGSSRLDTGLRALAWASVAATVAALLAAGALVQASPASDEDTEGKTAAAERRAGGNEE